MTAVVESEPVFDERMSDLKGARFAASCGGIADTSFWTIASMSTYKSPALSPACAVADLKFGVEVMFEPPCVSIAASTSPTESPITAMPSVTVYASGVDTELPLRYLMVAPL